jgi:hypothetical protein
MSATLIGTTSRQVFCLLQNSVNDRHLYQALDGKFCPAHVPLFVFYQVFWTNFFEGRNHICHAVICHMIIVMPAKVTWNEKFWAKFDLRAVKLQ